MITDKEVKVIIYIFRVKEIYERHLTEVNQATIEVERKKINRRNKNSELEILIGLNC